MAIRHLLLRLSPTLDRRWVIAIIVMALLVAAGTLVRWGGAAPPLDLVALGPEGHFVDTLHIPIEWGDTATHTPDAVVRMPLILGVRNRGRRAVQPERLSLSLPLRYRLTGGAGRELEGRTAEGSPLITYSLDPALPPVEPERLPTMLPAHDTIWLEVVVPSYYCVDVADSIPEFVPAPPPPVSTMSQVRIFYAFEGGDLGERRTGTLAVHMDSSLLAVRQPEPVPTFEMVSDSALAQPELGALQLVGSRRSQCGEPGAAMELLSTVWATPSGGRFIAIDYGGTVRKRLYDLDGDGVIERESWAGGNGEFTSTRRLALPTPAFLLPRSTGGQYDMARIDSLPPDSVARLDPFRRAMQGPGALPGGPAGPGADSAARALLPRAPQGGLTGAAGAGVTAPGATPPQAQTEPARDTLPEPRIRPAGPLGRPIGTDTVPRQPPRP